MLDFAIIISCRLLFMDVHCLSTKYGTVPYCQAHGWTSGELRGRLVKHRVCIFDAVNSVSSLEP